MHRTSTCTELARTPNYHVNRTSTCAELTRATNFCDVSSRHWYPKAKFRRRTSHEPNRIQMRKIHCSPSFTFDSAHMKYGVWTWPKKKSHFLTWTNGVASRRKLKTWGYLRHRLVRACAHLRWLELTYDDLRSLWSRSNLLESQSKFFTVWPPNPSQRKLIDVH